MKVFPLVQLVQGNRRLQPGGAEYHKGGKLPVPFLARRVSPDTADFPLSTFHDQCQDRPPIKIITSHRPQTLTETESIAPGRRSTDRVRKCRTSRVALCSESDHLSLTLFTRKRRENRQCTRSPFVVTTVAASSYISRDRPPLRLGLLTSTIKNMSVASQRGRVCTNWRC
ncbi:hypothetical protein BDV98DRAFT_561800 [Pterulicium gracile]|uniref:Uncharacterized protein n=1 Tax=Pterulicium gracile TaxID=1884261 RepID=A0A5C3QTS8_9AGAR|nr:hypothetical protein BDV98DRAFT_561800 [Pterula gracilis]